MLVLLFALILIVIIIITIAVCKKRQKKGFGIYEEIRPYFSTHDPYYSEVKISEDGHSSPDHQYDMIGDANELYDDILGEANHYYSTVDHYEKIPEHCNEAVSEETHNHNTAEPNEHSDDVTEAEHTEGANANVCLPHTPQDAGLDTAQVCSYEQVPTPNLADILRQVTVRNLQRNHGHSFKVKLFDTSRQADSIYESIATYEQVPDPAAWFQLQRSVVSLAGLYEVAQTYEVAETYEVAQTYEIVTGYERVRYSKILEEMFAHMHSGDMTIGPEDSASPCSLYRPFSGNSVSGKHSTVLSCDNSQTRLNQSDENTCANVEQPYERFEYKEDVVLMLKALASNLVSSEYETVPPYEALAKSGSKTVVL